MTQWKDITSYSRDEKDRVPSVWQFSAIKFPRIVIVRNHRYLPDEWVVTCSPWFEAHGLGLPSVIENRDEAKARAIKLVKSTIKEMYDALDEEFPA